MDRADASTAQSRATRAALLLAFAGSLAACQGHRAVTSPPVAVATYTVRASDETDDPPRFPAEVAPRYSNPLSFRVAGKVIDRRVRLGDRVTAGEVIARLDDSDQLRQVASARAALAAAEHRLHYAQQQLDRDQAQFARQLIAASQLEQTEDAHAAALAARDEAAAKLVIARNALRYHTLTADHDGVITSEDVDTGQVVSAGQSIYQLAWSGDIDVVIDVAANGADRVTVGQAARIVFPSLGSELWDARVREIAPAADPQSRTFRIKLTLTHPAPDLRLGMVGEAMLLPANAASSASGIEIPATALFHEGTHPAVWVLEGAEPRLALRPVTVSRYQERLVMLTGGLHEGDRIVAAGVHTVFAGERVTPATSLLGADDPEAPPSGRAGGAELAQESPP